MRAWSCFAGVLLLAAVISGQAPPATQPSAASEGTDADRKPFQDDILRQILREREAPRRIRQTTPGDPAEVTADQLEPGRTVLPEGSQLTRRRVRLVLLDDVAHLEFDMPGRERRVLLEVLPSMMLEVLERDASRGNEHFLVTGEVTRYRGENYVLVRQVTAPIDNGNLGP